MNAQISFTKLDNGQYDARTAIDSVSFRDCSTPLPTGPCDSDEYYMCPGTGVCVNKHDTFCDGVDDCGDFSDEANCGQYLYWVISSIFSPLRVFLTSFCRVLPWHDVEARSFDEKPATFCIFRSSDSEFFVWTCFSQTENALLVTFESGLGSWLQETDLDDFDWKRNQGETDTPGTGKPNASLSLKSGRYFLWPCKFNVLGVLFARKNVLRKPATKLTCISFHHCIRSTISRCFLDTWQ